MDIPFSEWSLKKAEEIVGTRKDADADINRTFYNGDHWQQGNGWIGPRPEGSNATGTLALIERSFNSRNAIFEVVNRHMTAVAGKSLHWKFTLERALGQIEQTDPDTGQVTTVDDQPTEQENALIGEAEAALATWLDRIEGQEILQTLVVGALLGKRAVLRLFVPPGLRDEQGNLRAESLDDALDKIWLQCLNLNEDTLEQQAPASTVYVDKKTRQEIGVFVYTDEDSDQEQAELCFVDEQGQTVLRILSSDADVAEPAEMPLGGRLTFYEMTRQALVTRQAISQQKALNLAETARSRNDVTGGFLERILLNAQFPGEWVDDATQASGKRFVEDTNVVVGAGTTNFWDGKLIEDDDGRRHYAAPSVHFRDPVAPDTFIRSSQIAYANILAECNQIHYLTAGDAGASGESRKQARDAYVADLQVTGGKVESAARWALETALALASYIAGQPGRFEGLRVYTQARLNTGPVGADERRSAREMFDAGLWSKESAMSETGIDDVDAELARMEQEQNQGLLTAPEPEPEPVTVPQTVDELAGLIEGNGEVA